MSLFFQNFNVATLGTIMEVMKPQMDDDIDVHPKVSIFVKNVTISSTFCDVLVVF